jgi:hypothetical protein
MASRGPLLLGALWLAAAVTATSVGLLAVHLVGQEVGGQVAAPLTDEGVQQALGSVSPTPTPAEEPGSVEPTQEPTEQPSGRASDRPSGSPAEGRARTVVTAGGVVSARCSDNQPTLLYATPADGYRTERGSRSVTFVGARQRVVLTMSCSEEELRTRVSTEPIGTRSPSPTPAVRPPSPSESPEPSEPPDGQDPQPEPAATGAEDR